MKVQNFKADKTAQKLPFRRVSARFISIGKLTFAVPLLGQRLDIGLEFFCS